MPIEHIDSLIEKEIKTLKKAGLGGLALINVRYALTRTDATATERERRKIANHLEECLNSGDEHDAMESIADYLEVLRTPDNHKDI